MTTQIEQDYASVERLILDVCNQFQQRHGGEFDEHVANANLIFMREYPGWCDYEPPPGKRKSKLSTWMQTKIYFGLMDILRAQISRNRDTFANSEAVAEELAPVNRIADYLDYDLSPDALLVRTLAIDPPDDLEDQAEEKGGQPRNFRSCIREYLSKLGWTAARIAESFQEIRECLR